MLFETHAILSVATGRLMGDIGGVYKVVSYLVGRNVFTHELVIYGEPAARVLKVALPELPTEDDFNHVSRENVMQVLSEWEQKLGSVMDLPDHMRDCLADDRNAVDTAVDLVGRDRVHVIRPE